MNRYIDRCGTVQAIVGFHSVDESGTGPDAVGSATSHAAAVVVDGGGMTLNVAVDPQPLGGLPGAAKPGTGTRAQSISEPR